MLRVEGLTRTFVTGDGQVQAVHDVSFEVETGEFFSLLGPSGCGKTTTLRCIAGLEVPDSGEIWIDDKLVFSSKRGIMVPVHEREIGMVFQSYAVTSPNATAMRTSPLLLLIKGLFASSNCSTFFCFSMSQ